MIENQKELEITKEALARFQNARARLEKDPIHKSLSEWKQRVYERAIEGEIAVLSQQIRDYESE